MNRQKIGVVLFWFGIIGVFVMQALTWIQGPIHRVHAAEELLETPHAINGALFSIRNLGGSGLALSLIGVLLATGRKGSYFWLAGLLPSFALLLPYWQPHQHIPAFFGIGGTIILLSYFGILWLWNQTYATYEGLGSTGRHIQLLGYSFLVSTGLLLCMYFGNPKQPALEALPIPIPSGESINLTLGLSMLLLFAGHYLVVRSAKSANPSS
jgi:hypothetical protein